jgi:hypothetical protein
MWDHGTPPEIVIGGALQVRFHVWRVGSDPDGPAGRTCYAAPLALCVRDNTWNKANEPFRSIQLEKAKYGKSVRIHLSNWSRPSDTDLDPDNAAHSRTTWAALVNTIPAWARRVCTTDSSSAS